MLPPQKMRVLKVVVVVLLLRVQPHPGPSMLQAMHGA
jgi:hypothetical protein